jgi:hypothetical protein
MYKLIALLIASITTVGLQLGVCAQNPSGSTCRMECMKCAAVCDSTIQHCHKMGGKHVAAEHINALHDCANLCRQSAQFMARGSELSGKLCALCAESCNRCADSCEGFKDDKAMSACAHECRSCADHCQKMGG